MLGTSRGNHENAVKSAKFKVPHFVTNDKRLENANEKKVYVYTYTYMYAVVNLNR